MQTVKQERKLTEDQRGHIIQMFTKYGELQYENGSKNRISAFGEADTLLYEFIEYMYKEI